MHGETTWWLGRVVVPGFAGERVVRLRTTGEAPGPEHVVEEIPDPFAEPEREDLWTIVEQAVPVRGGLAVPLGSLVLAPPVRPQKVLGIGRNFRAHARELGHEASSEPVVFMKPPSCLVASGATVTLPQGYRRIDLEGELVVVIGRRGRRIERDRALDHVGGYTLGNDVSCRDLQERDGQWTRAKGFDGFGPVGPFVRLVQPGWPVPADRVVLTSHLDDQLRQRAVIADMIFGIAEIVAFISEFATLEAGDLIFTGTPEGVTPLRPGQVVRVETEGLALGQLVTPIA